MLARILALSLVISSWTAFAQQSPAPVSPDSSITPADSNATATQDEAPRPKLDLTPDASGKLSQDQMRELARVVAENYRDNQRRRRDYTFIERDVENNIDGKGGTKSTEIKTFEILQIYGEQVWRLIEKDDKPLDAKEAAKEEEKIQKIIDKHKDESEEVRRKREEKEAKQRDDETKFVNDVAGTHDFTLVGTEMVSGREAWVIDGEPRPGAESADRESKFVAKFRGRLWIDKGDLQLAKLDIEATDTVSVGWVLARIHKGTRVMVERTRINDEVWLPKHLTFNLDARVALFKGYKVEADQTYRD
jgi:hypothetical protein